MPTTWTRRSPFALALLCAAAAAAAQSPTPPRTVAVETQSDGEPHSVDVNRVHSPQATCSFSVHEKNAAGVQVEGTSLNQELYYKISCQPESGYCLHVANCTVATAADGHDAYAIIDGNGCTNEPSLFEHVEYLNDYTAGIFNPYPIRFRNASASVHFQCSTTLKLRDLDGHCERPACTKSHYSAAANFHHRH